MERACAFRSVMFRAGPAVGSTTPSSSESVSPARLSSHFGLSCCGGCATRGFPTPFGLRPFPPDRGNRPSVSGAKQCRFRGPSVFFPRSGPSALLRISLYAPQGRGNHSHAPKYAFLNCVLLPYRIGRSGVPRPYSSGKTGSVQPTDQWVRRARPFARRRARTLRPLRVAIRLRKPCSLERWRFLG